MHDDPRATDDELEQGPDRIEAEEEMRGPGGADPELPATDSDADDGDDGDDE
ncbi:MAG: hypothetical protein K0T00_2243 [Gaiellaceae bacterium]|nr:hypothetical protein [Gaiellaceae bacterium]